MYGRSRRRSNPTVAQPRVGRVSVLQAQFPERRSIRHHMGRVASVAPGCLLGVRKQLQKPEPERWSANPKGTNAACTATGTLEYGSFRKAPRC